GKRSSEREHRSGTQTFGDEPRGNLQAGHGAGEQRAQQPELGKAQPELPLPDRQHHVDEVGIAVVQRMGAAGDTGGATLVALDGKPALAVHRWIERRPARDTHLAALISPHSSRTAHGVGPPASLRSTNTLLMNEITCSPCWFTPVLCMEIMPQAGWLFKSRVSITSLPYDTVSPT